MPTSPSSSHGGLPDEWTVTNGALEIVTTPESRIRLRLDANPNATVDMSVIDGGGGARSSAVNIEALGGGAAQLYVTENPVAGASILVDGRGTIEVFTIPGSKALTAWDADGNVLRFALLPAGQPMLGVTTAPADADLAASQCALWFDAAAPGALKVKAKDSGGTVRTATIALA